MESTLVVLASRCIPKQNGEVDGIVRNFKSSFYGHKRILRINSYSYLSNRAIVTSVVHITFPPLKYFIWRIYGKKLGKKVKKDTVVPDPDYRIPIVLLGLAGGLGYTNNLLPASPVGLLGLLLLVQEVKVGEQLEESGENVCGWKKSLEIFNVCKLGAVVAKFSSSGLL